MSSATLLLGIASACFAIWGRDQDEEHRNLYLIPLLAGSGLIGAASVNLWALYRNLPAQIGQLPALPVPNQPPIPEAKLSDFVPHNQEIAIITLCIRMADAVDAELNQTEKKITRSFFPVVQLSGFSMDKEYNHHNEEERFNARVFTLQGKLTIGVCLALLIKVKDNSTLQDILKKNDQVGTALTAAADHYCAAPLLTETTPLLVRVGIQ